MKTQFQAVIVVLSMLLSSCGSSSFQGESRHVDTGSGDGSLDSGKGKDAPIDVVTDNPSQTDGKEPPKTEEPKTEEPKSEDKKRDGNKGAIIGAILAGVAVAVGIAIISDDGKCEDDESAKGDKADDSASYHITPFNLAFRVYRGQLDGFPHGSYATMCQNLAGSKFDEQDVVDYAIKAGLADPKQVDCSYIKAVESQLEGTCR